MSPGTANSVHHFGRTLGKRDRFVSTDPIVNQPLHGLQRHVGFKNGHER
jgi:hypothetical protein